MRRQQGFSLIELLFALLILTIVMTTSLAVFVTRAQRLQQAADIILAYQVLANESEVVRRVDYGSLPLLKNDFTTDTALLKPLKPFKTKITVSEATPGVRNVALSIEWRNGTRQASLTLVRVDTGGTNLW